MTRLHRHHLRPSTINAIAFSPESGNPILATASDDNTVRLWDISDRHKPQPLGQPLTGHGGLVKAVAFSHRGRILATASGDSAVKLWDVDSQQLIATLTGHTDVVYGVAFSPDDSLLATVGGDKTMRLWDLDTKRVTDRICHIIGIVNPEEWTQRIPLPYQPTCH